MLDWWSQAPKVIRRFPNKSHMILYLLLLFHQERLYEELIEARVTINQLQMENTKLKTKNKIQEEALKNRNNVQSLHNSYVNTMEAFYSEERPP
jgi:FtsZ-binding cell division protein ZapB